jgi:hypothetical protein
MGAWVLINGTWYQLERFKQMAKDLECGPSKAEFEQNLGKIATGKPSTKTTKKG